MSRRIIQAALMFALAGCGGSGQSSAQMQSGGDGAGKATPAPAMKTLDGRPFTVDEIAATFDNPSAIAFLPGGGPLALVTGKKGHLWLVDVVGGRKLEASGLPPIAAGGQGGLLDVAFSPRFTSNRLIYLAYSAPSPNGGRALALATAELVRTGGAVALDRLKVIWNDPAGGEGGQFGGRIAFAPDGKSLFLSSGERQRFTPAQDPNQPLGKILHLTLDGKPAPGNPWAGKAGATSVTITTPPETNEIAKTEAGRKVTWPGRNLTPAETWTLGHRNQYGLAFSPDGRLWEAEAGPKGGDELNLIERGRNYGWPVVSNGDNYDGVPIPRHSTQPRFVAPKLSWTPTITPGDIMIYTGASFPGWKGDALIPGLNGEALIHVAIDGDKARKADRWPMGIRLRAIAQGPDGAVYLLQDGAGAKLLRLEPVR